MKTAKERTVECHQKNGWTLNSNVLDPTVALVQTAMDDAYNQAIDDADKLLVDRDYKIDTPGGVRPLLAKLRRPQPKQLYADDIVRLEVLNNQLVIINSQIKAIKE